MKRSTLSHEFLLQLLNYDPQTGVFTWAQPVSRKILVGSRAGTIGSNGRRYIAVMGEKHSAHRLAWFYHYGKWPEANISPKNGDYDDNRIDNLCEKTAAEIVHGGHVRVTNTSGIMGVSWSSSKKKWQATITRNYIRHHLGYFTSKEDAAVAYQAAVESDRRPNEGSKTLSVEEIGATRRLRAIWKRTLRLADGKTGWSHFGFFVSTIDKVPMPSEAWAVIRLNPEEIVGPTNFQWAFEPERSIRSQHDRRHRQENREGYRRRQLIKDFGPDADKYYQDKFLEQKGVCAICGKPETEKRNDLTKWLALDHHHDTGQLRGLLCQAHNKAIGLLGEDPELFQAAADYLRKYRVADNVVPLRKEREP